MKRLLNFILLCCLATAAMAQQKAPVDRSIASQVVADRQLSARYFFNIPRGSAPFFPTDVPDSLKNGALFNVTGASPGLYQYSSACTCWAIVSPPEGAKHYADSLVKNLNPIGQRNQQMFVTTTGLNNYFTADQLKLGQFVNNDADLASALSRGTASQQQIFKTFGRYSHGTTTGLPSNNIPGVPLHTNTWAYDTGTNTVNSTFNSGDVLGFYSADKFDYYTHNVTLTSTVNDNDWIAVDIAFMRDPTHLVPNQAYGLNPADFNWPINTIDALMPDEHVLTLLRGRNGSTTSYWIVYDYLKTTQKTIANGSSLSGLYNTLSNWSGNSVDIQIKRSGDTILTKTSQYSDASGGKGALAFPLTFNLNSDPVLLKFKGPQAYGYAVRSQQGASFTGITFSGNANTVYDLRNGNAWVYGASGYTLSSSRNFVKDIGPGRLVTDQYLHKTYYMAADSTMQLISSVSPMVNYNTNLKTDFPSTNALYAATNITQTTIKRGTNGNVRNDQSSSIMLANGEYHTVHSHFGNSPSDLSTCSIWKAISYDRGRTYGPDVKFIDTLAGGYYTEIPSTYTRQTDGNILVTYFARYSASTPFTSGIHRLIYDPTFTTVVTGDSEILPHTQYNLVASARLHKDTVHNLLLLPYSVLMNPLTGTGSTNSIYIGRLMISTDEGSNFTDAGVAITGKLNAGGFGGVIEAGIVESPQLGIEYYYRTLDGAVWANILTYGSGTYTAGAAFNTGLTSMNAGSDIVYLPKKNALLAAKTSLIGTDATVQANRLQIDLAMSHGDGIWNDVMNVVTVPAGLLVNEPVINLDQITDNVNVAYSLTDSVNTVYTLRSTTYPASYLNLNTTTSNQIKFTTTQTTNVILPPDPNPEVIGNNIAPASNSVSVVGGSAAASGVTVKSTSGTGTATGAAFTVNGGTNGGTLILKGLNNGIVGIGVTPTVDNLEIAGPSMAPLNTGGDLQNGIMKIRVAGGGGGTYFGFMNTGLYGWWQGQNLTTKSTLYPLILNPLGGTVSVGLTTPVTNAAFGLPAGTTTLAPLKIPAGTSLTSPIAGTIEFDGTDLFYTTSGPTRRTVANIAATQTFSNKTLTSPIINVSSDATGDIYYRNSGGLFTRLPVGSSNQLLSVSSGIPTWTTVAANIDNSASSATSANITLAYGNDYAFTLTGAGTWTLPAINAGVKWRFNRIFVKNRSSANLTINSAAGGNDIYTTSAVASVVLTPGQSASFISDGIFFNAVIN